MMRPLPLLLLGIARAWAQEAVLDHARGEMRARLPAAAPEPLTEQQRVEQDSRALDAAQASLGLVPVTLRLLTRNGVPVPGVAARAVHEALDVSAAPAVTDGRGEALLRLPRGPWVVDLATAEPGPGTVVFARVRFPVRGPGVEEAFLDRRREVRFRTRTGASQAAHAVTLAWSDFSFRREVDLVQGQLAVLTNDDAPMVVQAVRPPGDGPGYLFRQPVGPGTTVIDVEPEAATEHLWHGNSGRTLHVAYRSADALPLELSFDAKGRHGVRLWGLPEVVVQLEVTRGGRRHGFHALPVAVDGKPRTFTGVPPFSVVVGTVPNHREQYGQRVNSVSFRVLLFTANGLLLRDDARGPYSVAWEQVLDGQVRASGTTRSCEAVWTPPLDPRRMPDLRYRLQLRGPGENRKLETAAVWPTSEVTAGKVRTWCFPGLEANTRHWAACVDRFVAAYEQTCPHWKRRVDIERSIHMPLPVIGMGGYGGDTGWMWLPEHSVYGFSGTWYWTGLLSHELGHVFHYGHGDPIQSRIMQQAGRRAGRRLRSLRPGMEREPEGDLFRPLLEAVTRGQVSLETPLHEEEPPFAANDAPGDGILTPNLEITGDDAVFTWFWRRQFGPEVERRRRDQAATWSWWLTLRGYDDDEIQIAIFSRAADTSLAWLARMREIRVHDHRIAAAMEDLKANERSLVGHEERGRILHAWRTRRFAPSDDLAEAERAMGAELGHRQERYRALLAIAREHFVRDDPDGGEATLARALAEARRGGDAMLEMALREAAPLWAAR